MYYADDKHKMLTVCMFSDDKHAMLTVSLSVMGFIIFKVRIPDRVWAIMW